MERIHLTRLNQDYAPALRLCRLLLEGATLSTRAGGVEQLALVFDMNRLCPLISC